MAIIMSMEEWDRKRKNKSVSVGSAAPASSVKDSSATESKRRVLPSLETWENSQSYDTSLKGFAKQADTTVRAIQKYYSEYHDDEDKWYDSYDQSLSTLLSSADRYRREYADDADVVASIDQIADTLSKTQTYIKEANKRNKRWKDSESYNTAMNRLEEADKINTLYGMSTQEIEAAQLEAQGIGTEELEVLLAKKKSLEQKANAYSFSRSVTQEQKKAVQNELAQVNNAIQSAEQKSAIAYTTMDGQNITWDALYRRKQKEENYAEFSKRDDWAENSTYKSTVPDENADYNDFSQPTVDWDYEEMNNPETFSHLRGGSTYRSEHMTKEEMEMFNYIYHTQGRDAAFDWQRSLAEDLETLRVQDIAAKTKEFASKSPLHGAAAWVGARLTSPLAGAEYVGDLVDNLFVPEKSMRNTFAARNAAVDSAITEQVDWNIGKWDAFDFGYGTLASAVDSALASLLPGGEVVLGLSAAASATNAALDRGMDEKSAVKAGIAAGVAESVFEHLSIGQFKKLQMIDPKSPKDFIFNTIKSMGVNASEEAATEIANSVYDIYVNGEFSDYETNVRMMVQSGMTPEEARAEAKKTLGKQIAEAAASGALMGFGFGVTGSAIGYNSGLKQTGKETRSADGFELKGLANESLQLNPDNKLAQRVLDKGKASDRQVGKLVRSNEDARHVADVENTRQAVTARLTALKATENVEAVADAVTKYVTGEKLTKAEQELIRRNRVAPQVVQEIREQKRAEMYMRIVKAAQIAPETQETESDAVLDSNENIAQKERAVSVVSLENGKMLVKRENGETVNAKSYRADGSDQVYETIRNISADVEEANTYVQAYAASPVSAETFEKGLRLAQMYGAKNFPIEELESTSAGKLPENIRTMAYDHAQQSVQAAEAFLTEIGMSSESIKSVFAESPMDGRVDLNDMANGIRVAFQYGVVGIDKAKAPAGSDGLKLTDAQWNIAYQDGRAYARKRTDTVQTQNQTRKISKVKADKNAKVVNGVKYHGVSVSKRAMNERQRAGIEIAELLASMGMDVHLHQSIMDLNGQYVFTDDAGVYRSDNGFYRKRDGSIHIDVNAGIDGEGLLAYTLSHELTHFVEDWSPEKFKLYADTLISELGKTEADVDADLNRMINRVRNDPQYSKLTKQEKQDIAYSELIAEYSETMLANTDVLKRIAEKIKAKDKRLAQKIHDFFAGIVKKLREAYKDYKPNSRLAQEAEQTIRNVDALAEVFADAVVDAADRFAKAEAVLNESGVAIDAETDTAILESARYAPKNQEEIDAAANALSQRLGVSFKEARAWVENEVSIASLILNPKFDNLELAVEEQAEWDKLDYKSDGRRTAIKKNAEHKQGTLDFSNICRKRREYTSMMNRIQKAFPNHIFTANELAQIRKIMLEEGIEVACGICYVEDRRQNDTAIAKGFVDALERFRNGETTHEDGKPFNKNQLKALRMVGEDIYVPTLYELTTREGLNELRRSEHESIAKAWETFNNARGMQAVRLLENEAEYKRQILKYNDRRVKRINDLGGLRIFSFSDFEEFHLIDIIQAIQDCAAMGIKIQGYTKVPSFAKLLKDTGVKLNRSLIAKGDLGYRVENGKAVLEYDTVEGIDINSEDFFDSTDNPNVGNILVGINYEQISAAMLDDFVDYIIPFHTGQGKEVLTAKNISAWKNYKDSQTDKDIATGTTAKKQVNIYTDVLNAAEKEGNPITDKVTFVQKFLDVCKERGIKPRFAEFLNVDSNGDYAYREGYHKFLVDFKMFDRDGNILPQNTVKPEFDNAYMTKLLTDYVKREAAKEAELSPKLDKAYNRVLNEVVKVPKTKQDITLSSPRESDTDSVQELTVNDVAKTQNGSLMVNINSRASGLSGHRKGEWPRIVSEMIRNTLSGKSIITEEGDIITVTRRGAREVGFGTDTQVLKTDARQRRDYSKVEQKMITAEHTASIIALSKYDTWSANNEDPSDSFKKDGLNYRKVELLIDGVPHTATVVTALNGDTHDRKNYGEKFYDIENIEEQTNLSASYGATSSVTSPHIIKMADGSSDRLTVTQKQRIVNNKKSTYSSSGGAAKTATAIALEKALAQNSDHKDGNLLSQRDPDGGYSNRSLLANALESAVQHEVEAKRLVEYKAGIAEMSKQQKKLSELTEEWRSLMFAKGTRSAETKARIEALREEIDKTAVRINDYDKKLLRLEAAAPLQKVLEREKAKALKKAKEKEKVALKDQRADFNERVKKQKLRSSVEKNAKSLINMMSHPTKDAHVPHSMLEPLNEFLESIDFVSKQQSEGGEATIRDIAYTRALNGVRRAVEGQVSAMNGSDFAGEYTLDINADFIKKIDEHIKEIEDATKKLDTGTNRVYAMNGAELKQLSEILRTINKAIRDIDKLHMQGAKARVSDLAADTKQELSRRKPVKTDDGGKAMWANYTPWHAFRRMGKSAQQIFKGLMQGQAKLAQNVNAVIEFTEKTYSAKEVKKWESDIHTVELSSGDKVKLTTAQLMSFYCLSQREHALDHLTGGGIRVVTIEDGLKKIRQPNKFLLSLEDITKINELLMKNERAFAVAKELQKYMSSVGSDLINEISMARWDYMAATEKNYFPIKTDETSRDVKDPGQDTTNLWALLNKSFTKGLTEGANNAIYVESIFDVFADHMSEASEYNAFALPLVDAMRWFNYRERNKLDGTQVEDSGVHDTIKTVLGSAAVDYFRNLMTDINSSQKAGRHENIAGQILSRSKISSVGYNLRVMIQQPTAILRASLILDPGSLLKGTARIRTKELVKEMQQYSGIALWKSMGYYDLNVSRSVKEQIKHDNSFIDKANDVGTWLPGKMDEVTWARIWAAAKAQVAKNQKLKGEALLKATAELFEEIVYQTQVADSVLTRSSLMRSKSQFMKEATSFMAEPTVSLNILLSAFQDYEEGHKTWDKVKRGVMIGFAGYAMSSIVNACITALADAWRDDDEYEEFHEKYLQALFGEKSFFDGNLFAELNPLEKIVFVKDVFSVLKGYDVMPGYADLFKSGYDLVTNYQKFIEGRGTITLYGLIYNTLQVVGTVGGIGLSNIAREVVGVWNHTVGMIYPEMKLVRYDIERKNQIRSALEGGSLSDEEAMELLVEEGVAENEDEAYFTVEKWRSEDPQHYSKYNDLFEAAKAGKSIDKALKVLTDHGVKEKDAISTLKSKIGKWYTGTKDVPPSINKQETINMLEKYTDMKESEIAAQVNKWTAVVVTGIKYQDIEEKFISGEIKESRAIEMRAKYGGQTQKEAAAVVSRWKCEKDTGIPYDSLREEFVDGNITEKEAVNSMVKYGGIKQREAEETVTGWKAEKETGVAYSSIRESFLEGELTESEAIDMYKNYGGMSQSEAEDAAAALQFEKDYGFSYSNKREAYIDGEISETTLRKALIEYGEKSAEDAENTIRAYDWMKQNPEYDLSESEAVAYTKPLEEYGGYSVADTGLDPDIFISYKEQVGECEGVDSNGDGKADNGSKKKQILALIDSLPISNTQKDALYFASGNWTASKLYEAPWR